MPKLNQQMPLKTTVIMLLLMFLMTTYACENPQNKSKKDEKVNTEKNEKQFITTMQKHLDAVSHRDLAALKSTMSPEGKMQLILPGSEIIKSVDGFMNYHTEWFKDTTAWTFETKILNTEVGKKVGIAITEIIYREPERNGVPYFNRMIVSYALEKIDHQWYIIKDHASSVEKSTD